MSTLDAGTSSSNLDSSSTAGDAVDSVVEAVAKASLQDEVAVDAQQKTSDVSHRPLRVYSRNDILHLSKSPLVNLPEGMPALADWFGDWNEQVGNKKESESSTTTTARDRRFRRDAEDGDSSRASFRSGLTQPSQMGNFRHQSIRTTDRGSEKEVDRERERDLRDREGQERLRNLSDKYDRDRLALSSVSTLRNKDRDAAPHLSGTSTSRLGQSTTTGRRAEGRDAPKKRTGESSDDWRRGAEPNRAGRDDKLTGRLGNDGARRDRETRDRPRSRVRDSSRPRRESSTTRRDRDREDRDRPRDRRGDGDRDDRRDRDDNGRRDRDDYLRRDWDDPYDRDFGRRAKDVDRDTDDDPRRWRDDGRRDERMAARRERERGWDRYEDRDRERPSAGDDRDARNRRGTGRDRRLGVTGDDTKDREDRRDRDRDREAEPAWMETYVPTTPGGGILGGKMADGELDGIQAWKKGMKEKERKEKGGDANVDGGSNGNSEQQGSSTGEGQMDEIQLFKLMMKREAEKKEGEKPQNGQPEFGPPGLSNSSSLQSNPASSEPAIAVQPALDGPKLPILQSQRGDQASRPASTTGSAPNGAQSLVSSLVTDAGIHPAGTAASSPSLERSLESSRVMGPRLNQATSIVSQSTSNVSSPVDLSSHSATNTFNPPAGSRLLALKSRNGLPTPANQLPPPGLSVPYTQSAPGPSAVPPHLPEATGIDLQYGGSRLPSDPSRGIRSFSPLSSGSQPNVSVDDFREAVHLGQLNEGIRRASGSAAERAILGIPGDNASYNDLGGAFPPGITLDQVAGANLGANKGSRFAKFFDSRTREPQATGPRLAQQGPPLQTGIPHPRQEALALGGVGGPRGERTMEDIFAMLQSSTQSHRVSPQIPQTGRIPQGGNQFAQSLELQILQQQQQQQQHQQIHQQQLAQNNRLDALYDSRLDDRNFVPDGLVPGLRPAPPRSRSREPGGILFNEQIDDPLHFNVQRLTQQRNLEQMYNAPAPSMYAQQQQQQAGMLRNGGLPIQPGQFRGASPIASQNPLQPPSQRLPPGLANLGGRPPHDPSQYLAAGVGLPGGGLHGATPAQQVYNTFTQGGLGFNGNPQLRGPPGPQNPPWSGPGYGPQQGPGGQMSASHLAMRQQHLQQQQQQQHLPPQMLPHLLPSHLQQQGVPGGNAQTTQDLMALLMGGHRE
ncbi:hypothetical protein C8Q78DRAFT_1139173 [Trametes maxima]|nr:hypothetical protein C8Q78DRAFT_1139173 [Trametes maxima]